MYSLAQKRVFYLALATALGLLLFAGCGPRRPATRPNQSQPSPTAEQPPTPTLAPALVQSEPAAEPTQAVEPTSLPEPTATTAAAPEAAAGEQSVQPLSDVLGVVALNTGAAVCNDGSPAKYYLRQGYNNKWLVFLEGGGACFRDQDCSQREREQPKLTSSDQWDPSVSLGGIFSINEERNPDFWNWNQVYVKYCSSDSWSGSHTDADGRQFRGRDILEAVFTDVQQRNGNFGVGKGSDSTLILAGCSAGGNGVLNNLDAVAGRFADNFDDIRGINDAGWAVDIRPSYAANAPSFYEMFSVGFGNWGGNVDADCAAAGGDPAQCYFGSTVYPYITTPLFVQIHQYDREQITSFHSGTQQDAEDFAVHVRASLVGVQAAFSPQAPNHCVTINDKFWGDSGAEVDGYSMQEVLHNWLNGEEPIRLVAP
ncbi:MAG: pectin acetylesterase-family hydrolase [Chloroflexota bacterium]